MNINDLEFLNVSSELSQKIERTTREDNPGLNPEFVMDICRLINSNNTGPHEALRTFTKRLYSTNSQVLSLTLSLIEVCASSCGKRFHLVINNNEFMDRIAYCITHDDERVDFQAKRLLQVLVNAFKSSSRSYNYIFSSYSNLKSRGIEFPDVAAVALPSTPSLFPTKKNSAVQKVEEPEFTVAQIEKLKKEISIAKHNGISLEEEVKNFSARYKVSLTDDSYNRLRDIHNVNNEMRRRIGVVIQQVHDKSEELLDLLLEANDILAAAATHFLHFSMEIGHSEVAQCENTDFSHLGLSDEEFDFDASEIVLL